MCLGWCDILLPYTVHPGRLCEAAGVCLRVKNTPGHHFFSLQAYWPTFKRLGHKLVSASVFLFCTALVNFKSQLAYSIFFFSSNMQDNL